MNTGLRSLLYSALIITGLCLADCSGAATSVGMPTRSPAINTPTTRPTVSLFPPTTPAPTGGVHTSVPGVISPVEPITLADNGSTITLNIGQTFLLNLGDEYTWGVTVDDPGILSREVNILVIKGAQGVYKANAPGKTNLTATGDPPCRQSTPPCMAPSIEFQIQVIVNPN